MVLSQINDHGHEHGESLALVGLQNIEEVVVLEEAHSAIGNLQMDSANALHDAFEKTWYQWLDFLNFAHFENLLQLSKEKSLLYTVSKWPVFQEAFKQRDRERSVFCEEEHWAAQQLLVELTTGLNFVQGDYNILEEDHVLIS